MTTITVPRKLIEQALDYVELVPDDRGNADHIDRFGVVYALTAALAQQAEPSGWRPISTAPKDGGRIILGYAGTGFSEEGFWSDDAKANHWRMVGWFASSDNLLTDKPSQPTHWHPMPNPPESSNDN